MRNQHLTRRLLSLLLACVMMLTSAPQALAAESAQATTMQLKKTEGSVSITNNSGRNVSVRDSLRLYNGYHLDTEEASYAWIDLDKVKLVKMDAVTEIGIRKSGKLLDILVDSGNLFFNVTEPLTEEESLNIRTATMVVGIRGTSGWVKVIDQWTTQLFILEGTVEVTVIDPVTNETITETVSAGETVICTVYPQDRPGTKCAILRQKFTAGDVEGFVLADVLPDAGLCEKIYAESGIDLRGAGLSASDRLAADQAAVREKLAEIEERFQQQEHNISRDPVWTNPVAEGGTATPTTPAAPNRPSGGNGGADVPTPPDTSDVVTLMMPQTAATVNDYLSRAYVRQVILVPGTTRNNTLASTANLLEVDTPVTVPSGKILTLQTGVNILVLEGQSVTIQGTMTVDGEFVGEGMVAPSRNAQVKAKFFKLLELSEGWSVSETADGEGFYSLVYTGTGTTDTITITFDYNGLKTQHQLADNVRHHAGEAIGTLVSSTPPTWDGYTFTGWYTAPDGGTRATENSVFYSDTTLYAHWTPDGTLNTPPGATTLFGTVSNTAGQTIISAHVDLSLNGTVIKSGMTDAQGKYSMDVELAPQTTYNLTASAGGYSSQTAFCTVEDNTRGFLCNFRLSPVEVSGVSWRYDETTTTLYIEGSGTMESIDGYTVDTVQQIETIPWDSYKSNITHIEISEGITTIGGFAFEECNNLVNIAIPESITSIGLSAFYNCSSLSGTLNLPNGITNIGSVAFYNCSSLTGVTIPTSVTRIENGAFGFCSSLTSVTIPNSVSSIQEGTFAYCSNLASVTIPSSVTSIENNAFYECGSLTNVTIPASVTSIGSAAFGFCNSLTSVTIPDGVTSIQEGTFTDCTGLASVTIPTSVTSIGDAAFFNCQSLTSIAIPASVTALGDNVFDGSTDLTDVYYGGTAEQWDTLYNQNTNGGLASATIHYNSTRSIVSNTSPSPYTDVPADAWYAEAVEYCRVNGLMTGTSSATFSPDAPLTRAMTVTVLHCLAGKPAASAPAAFTDVQPDAWYADAIAWASGEKIVLGYSPETFGVNAPVTHEQLSLIFQRYSGDPNMTVAGADAPKANATRAEVAATVMNCAVSRRPGSLASHSAIDVMCAPSGIVLDQDGSLVVTDVYSKQLWRVRDRSGTVYAGSETVRDLYGQPVGGYNDAALLNSFFKEPWAAAPFLDGWAVSDTENDVVRLVRGNTTQTLNGATKEHLKVTDMGVAFNGPTGLAADGEGNLYVSDTRSGAVRRITSKGGVTTVAKNLSEPMGLCWKDGVLYIAEAGKNRIVTLKDGKVDVLAGSGSEGLTDGSAMQAAFSAPQGVAVGNDGSVYVADTGNGAVRKIQNGSVTTLAVRDLRAAGGMVMPRGLLLQGNVLYICDPFARRIFTLAL